MADYSDIRYVFTGVTEYATVDNLPTSGNSTGDQALVTGTNRLYLWNGSGWYNIALINTTPSISGASSSYALASDGTATTVTITATDPEGLPITYSIASDTSGSIATVSQGTGSNTNVFTITPSTNTANAGTFSLTFRASDGVNIATAVSSFTLIFAIENSNYTTALVTSVGANNAVNNSFDDASTNNHTITANGNVTQNTFSPYRHSGYSTYFDGNGDYLTVPDDTSLDFGGGDFTLECWINLPERSSGNPIIFGSGWYIQLKTGDTKISFWGGGGVEQIYTGTALELNRWYHIAVVRDNGQITMYLDGSSVLTSAYTTSVNTTTNVSIGRSTSNALYFKGYIRDVRVVKGSAIVPSSGGPSEPLTAVTNTSLLTCHLPYIADGSTNGYSITVNGNTKTEPFSPYTHNGYSASSNGGSMYFDGSGDRLDVGPDNSFLVGTGSVTMECWCYPAAVGQDAVGDVLMLIWSGTNNAVWLSYTSNKKFNFRIGYQGGSTAMSFDTTNTYELNQWHHVAVVRNSSDNSAKIYVNGVNDGSSTNSTDLSSTYGSDVDIAGQGAGRYFQGHITDARIVKDAVYTSNFSAPTAPLTAITNTSLLLGGTNAGIIDKSQSVKSLTLNGDVKSSTTQSKYLSSSMYFDGTGDSLSLPDSPSLNFGSGDSTIEMWVYPLGTGTFNLMTRGSSGYSGFILSSTGFLESTDGATWAVNITFSTAITANSWQHVAVVRNGSTITIYRDGTSVGTASISGSVSSAAQSLVIGERAGQSNFQGYMSDVRITKGLARYTANFTAPTAALQG